MGQIMGLLSEQADTRIQRDSECSPSYKTIPSIRIKALRQQHLLSASVKNSHNCLQWGNMAGI